MDDAKINAAVKYLSLEAIRSDNPIAALTKLLNQLDEQSWSHRELGRIKSACWRIVGVAYGVFDEPTKK